MILHAKNTSLLLIVVSMLTFESGCIGLITHKKDVVTPAHQKGWLEMGMKKREVTAILGPAHEFSAMPTQHGFQETLTYYHTAKHDHQRYWIMSVATFGMFLLVPIDSNGVHNLYFRDAKLIQWDQN